LRRIVRLSPSVERACDALAIIGCVWFAFTAFWGIAAIPSGGHLGAGAACNSMVAEASIRWHTWYPLYSWYTNVDPYPQAAYCHHPMGAYWAARFLLQLFGHRDFVPNMPSAILSALTAPLVWKTARRAWGPIAGMAGVFGLVFLPITVGYSIFNNLEVMTMFGGALFFYGHLEYEHTGQRRHLALSLLGALFTTSGDWVGYLIMAPLLAWSFLRAFVLPDWMTPRFSRFRYQRWWALSVGVAVCTLALWLGMFKHADKLIDWLSSADQRSGASTIPIAKALEARKSWIEFSFTPFAIAVGKLALPIAFLRFIVRRRDEEIFSLAALFGAAVQYIVFKSGADVHIFWPQYFGLYYAYALAQLVATAGDLARFVASFLHTLHSRLIVQVASLVVALVPSLLVAPDAIRSLKIWRETGGRYNDKGTLFRSHVDMLVVEEALVRPRLGGQLMGVHPGANFGWEHNWAIAGLAENVEEPSGAYPFWLARASGVGGDHMKTLASKFHLRIYGDVVFHERGDGYASVDAYSMHEHEPNIFQWMFVNNTEPVRTVPSEPDPWLTWEWRTHLDQAAAIPTAAPVTIDELRIAHNIKVSLGDVDGAERLREQIVAQISRDPNVYFDGGHELIGVRVTGGVQPRIQSFFVAGGPTKGDTTFAVHATVLARLPTSLIPPDPIDRELAFAPPLSTKLWKKGFMYVFECNAQHRIGVEVYRGRWVGGPTMKSSPTQQVDLVTLR
jgi:hypothetical protein